MISNSYRWAELVFDYNIKMLSWPDPHNLSLKMAILGTFLFTNQLVSLVRPQESRNLELYILSPELLQVNSRHLCMRSFNPVHIFATHDPWKK